MIIKSSFCFNYVFFFILLLSFLGFLVFLVLALILLQHFISINLYT